MTLHGRGHAYHKTNARHIPSLQASKYQRRYFELTADTLAYAKDARELKDGGGNIEVFAIHELKYIKKLEDAKLEVGLLGGKL